MSKCNLAVWSLNPKDATSLYRAWGPLGTLQRQVEGLNIVALPEYSWATLKMIDVLFVQRPYKEQQAQVIELAKLCGIPIWVDYDDDLFSVPTDNPNHHIYNQPGVQKITAKCIAAADVVTVTTEHLKKKLSALNKDIRVIPNAFDDELIHTRPKPQSPRHPLILWRGSNTHQRDVMSHATEIVMASKRFPKWTWNFMGYNPWAVTDSMRTEATLCIAALDPIEYFQFIANIQPAIAIVPLVASDFNRAKSNIAWMEACYAGAVALGPDLEEWRRPGCLNYKNQKDFYEQLLDMMTGKVDLEKEAAAGWEFIQENLRLTSVNWMRRKLVQELMDRRIRINRFPGINER